MVKSKIMVSAKNQPVTMMQYRGLGDQLSIYVGLCFAGWGDSHCPVTIVDGTAKGDTRKRQHRQSSLGYSVGVKVLISL